MFDKNAKQNTYFLQNTMIKYKNFIGRINSIGSGSKRKLRKWQFVNTKFDNRHSDVPQDRFLKHLVRIDIN